MFHRKLYFARTTLFSLFATVMLFAAALGARAQQTINVPAAQATIQAAINAANNGDTVLVAPGTYVENINFNGKAITVTSSGGPSVTIIDGNANGSVVIFDTNETTASVLHGFTLRNGLSEPNSFPCSFSGGGICIYNASPTISGNIITSNRASEGAGISASFSSAIITGNTVTLNQQCCGTGGPGGGGIYLGGVGSAQVLNNTITNNFVTSAEGGGISLFNAGTPTIAGNLVSGNSATGLSPGAEGGGIMLVNQSDALIVNNIIIGNTADQGAGVAALVPSGNRGPFVINNTIVNNKALQLTGSGVLIDGFDSQSLIINNIIVAAPGENALYCGTFTAGVTPIIQYNDVLASTGNLYSGNCTDRAGLNGNISADPLFTNASGSDYHLQLNSPAIDAGSNSAQDLPSTDYDRNPRITDGNNDGVATVDLGAFELVTTAAANIAPNTLTFSPQLVGSTSNPESSILTSTGTTPFQITSIQVSGDFALSGSTCSASVPTGTSCTYSVTFTPTGAGTRTGSLTVNGTNGVPLLVSLAGTGPGQPTTTAVTSDNNPSAGGQSVTLTANVQITSGSSPTGTVTFFDGATTLGTATLSGSSAQISTSSLALGSHSITAKYSGDANFSGSTSPVLTETVDAIQATTTITSNINPSASEQLVTFTATVHLPSGSSPTGTVTFFDGATSFGTSSLSGSSAQFLISILSLGSHSITAKYSGDANFAGSTSPVLTQTVNLIQTTTTLTSNNNPATVGQTITLTANVQIASGIYPTGTVTFLDGGTTLAASPLTSSSAHLSVSSLAVGSHSITAIYSGDANFGGSTSSALIQTVNPIASSGLAIDAQVSKDQSTAKSSVATAAFSTTAANELLLAFVATDFTSGSNTTVTSVTGGGLTWTLVVRSNKQSGTSEIWRAFAPSALSNITVTAALSHSVVSSMTVVTYTGANTSGTGGSGAIGATTNANASSGAPTASLVTTHNNSWVFGVGNDYDNAITRTPGANQTVVHQYLSSTGDTYWVQRQNAPTMLSGTSVTINDSAPTGDRYNLAICEVLPAQ